MGVGYDQAVPRLRDETRAERRRQFVQAAWRCAETRGYRDMTVDDVCAEAGLTKGAFYSHFESKQALLVALIDDDSATLAALAHRLDSGSLRPVEKLRRLTQAMLERGADSSRVQVVADLWAAINVDEEVRDALRDSVARRRAALRSWIEEAVESSEIQSIPANAFASVLLALNDGLMFHHALDASGFRWSNVSRAVDALLNGIRVA